jgi:hypothetical protein
MTHLLTDISHLRVRSCKKVFLSDKGARGVAQKNPEKYSVEDPHHVDTDPDPTFHFDADPDLTSHQSHASLQPLALQTLQGSILTLHGSRVSLHGSILSLQSY